MSGVLTRMFGLGEIAQTIKNEEGLVATLILDLNGLELHVDYTKNTVRLLSSSVKIYDSREGKAELVERGIDETLPLLGLTLTTKAETEYKSYTTYGTGTVYGGTMVGGQYVPVSGTVSVPTGYGGYTQNTGRVFFVVNWAKVKKELSFGKVRNELITARLELTTQEPVSDTHEKIVLQHWAPVQERIKQLDQELEARVIEEASQKQAAENKRKQELSDSLISHVQGILELAELENPVYQFKGNEHGGLEWLIAVDKSGKLFICSGGKIWFGSAGGSKAELGGEGASSYLELVLSDPEFEKENLQKLRLRVLRGEAREDRVKWMDRINILGEQTAQPTREDLESRTLPDNVSLAIIKARHWGHFVGQHANGIRNGRGLHTWSNGYSQDGTWENDVLVGQATEKWSSGAQFVGEFINGKRDGKGRHDLSNDTSSTLAYREGIYKQGYLSSGEIVYRNGVIQRGGFEWRGGDEGYALSGPGRHDLSKDPGSPIDFLEGEFKLGHLTNGEIVYKSGAVKRGAFEWDEKDQAYVLVDGEETALDPQGQVGFKGIVKNRQRVSGYFKFSDGTSFEGDLLEPIAGDGTQQRQGTLKLPGVEVVGKFIGFGKVEGSFTAKFADGSAFEGADGVISGDNLLSCDSGTLLQPDGSRVKAYVEKSVAKKKLLGGIFG